MQVTTAACRKAWGGETSLSLEGCRVLGVICLRDFPLVGSLDKAWSLSLSALAQLPMENGDKGPDSLSHSEKSVRHVCLAGQ